MINDASAYPEVASESMALMIGFCSALYLAAAFLTYRWLFFLFGNVFSTILVIIYFVREFNLSMFSLAPSLVISSVTCCSVAYFVECQDKLQFLDKKRIEGMQQDLKKVVQHLPEGVMIFETAEPDNVKLFND